MTTQLLSLIDQGRSQVEVEGGMRVLNEFVGSDLTEDQFLPLAQQMLPRLLEILGDDKVSHTTPIFDQIYSFSSYSEIFRSIHRLPEPDLF